MVLHRHFLMLMAVPGDLGMSVSCKLFVDMYKKYTCSFPYFLCIDTGIHIAATFYDSSGYT